MNAAEYIKEQKWEWKCKDSEFAQGIVYGLELALIAIELEQAEKSLETISGKAKNILN